MRYFIPYVEVFGRAVIATLSRIKKAGFDGIECHLIGSLRSAKRVAQLRKEVADVGLAIRFHQGWSWETGQRGLYNRILRPLGALVPVGESLEKQLVNANTDEVVVYGSRIKEPNPGNYVYQTASEYVHGKEYSMSYPRFVRLAQWDNQPLVLDTQHVLEWARNVHNVTGLSSDPDVLLNAIHLVWRGYGRKVKEIHLNDFNPSLGPSRGRNVFLGDGMFPLAAFCKLVRASGWDGIVTPEVAPQHLRKDGSLQRLHGAVVSYMQG